MSILRIELEDGTTIEGTVEAPSGTDLGEIVAAGPLRVRLDESEVEGHELSSTIRVIVAGPDDTEGHALSLRLPDARAARDLERRILVAGALAGIIMVGAASATVVAPSLTTGAQTQAAAVHDSAPAYFGSSSAIDTVHDSAPAYVGSPVDTVHDSAPAYAGSPVDTMHDSAPAYAGSSSTIDTVHDSAPAYQGSVASSDTMHDSAPAYAGSSSTTDTVHDSAPAYQGSGAASDTMHDSAPPYPGSAGTSDTQPTTNPRAR